MSSTTRINSSAALALTLLMTLFRISAAQQTINIEIDYMVLRDAQNHTLHTHRPQPEEIAAVVQMFACHDIIVNIDVDDSIPHQDVICPDPNGLQGFFSYTGMTGFGRIKNQYYDHVGQAGWHYCVFAHNYSLNKDCTPTGSSGIAELGGDDLIVSLGSGNNTGTPFDRAATLAHEFGHNLGLTHCGGPGCGEAENYKPNFPSIMNYRYQLNGVRAQLEFIGLTPIALNFFKNIDYSGGNMCFLNEMGLDEVFGSGMKSVDWDCNGVISGVGSGNLNGGSDTSWCNSAGAATGLTDYNEWQQVRDHIAKSGSKPITDDEVFPIQSCLTWDGFQKLSTRSPRQPQPALEIEPCAPAQMIYLKSTTILPSGGSCDAPYQNITQTLGPLGVPPGSILYLAPGVYVEPAGPLILTKPMTITAVGTAIVTVAPSATHGNEVKK